MEHRHGIHETARGINLKVVTVSKVVIHLTKEDTVADTEATRVVTELTKADTELIKAGTVGAKVGHLVEADGVVTTAEEDRGLVALVVVMVETIKVGPAVRGGMVMGVIQVVMAIK